jgi:hypothetical protein
MARLVAYSALLKGCEVHPGIGASWTRWTRPSRALLKGCEVHPGIGASWTRPYGTCDPAHRKGCGASHGASDEVDDEVLIRYMPIIYLDTHPPGDRCLHPASWTHIHQVQTVVSHGFIVPGAAFEPYFPKIFGIVCGGILAATTCY